MSRYPTDWIEAGACLNADPDLFFPVATGEMGSRQAAQAQRICERCQVRRECLEYAMANSQVHGIWGGTTPEDRIRLRRQRSDQRRRGRRGRERVSAA
ncbi:MAG: WhiB family transcriptional regulator [Nocardiopsaceae bacterium]|nr:WhiB family transcriptional regulator [Nocardiopsaceae bacterium]